ncbi:MAG: putative heme-binding domain-containing protein, partial [Verrucomicrobiales bacterium]
TAFRALAMLGQHEPCFSLLDASSSTPAERLGAARALMRMHQPEAVDGIIARLQKEKRPDVRQLLLAALCRLASTEADWNGASWGTRPDTRGPYYQPVAWSESPKVIAALKAALAKAGDDEAAFLIREMDRNRIQNSEVFERILALAAKNPELIPDAIAQMAKADSVSPAGVVMLLKAADNPQTPPASLAQAITALSKLDGNDALSAMLAALVHIEAAKDSEREKAAGRKAFLGAPKLENHHLALETFATNNPDAPSVIWADAGLITLAERKKGSPESREMSLKAIDESWKSPARRIALINAAVKINSHALDERIRKAFDDSDQAVAAAAQGAAKSLKLDQKQRDKTPKVATFAPEKALAQIIKTKGDVALGEQVFTRATCVACHTTDQEQAQRGPYLGNIAQTYKRRDLAESIIDPNKSIAQGFASNVITDKDGKAVMGFVTDEAGDSVTVRDIAANEHTFKKADIAKRDTIPTSMMPPGLLNALTVYEAASLLDYLEALAKKK